MNGTTSPPTSSAAPATQSTPAAANGTAPSTQPGASTQSGTQPGTQNSSGSTEQEEQYKPDIVKYVSLLLANHGVTSFDERVPLQLIDFSYRYTQSILTDAQLFLDSSPMPGNPATITEAHLDMAIASKVAQQFSNEVPLQFYLDEADRRNKIALPPVSREYGLRLPPEKYTLTGTGWRLDEGVFEEEEEVEEDKDEVMEDA